MICAMVQQLFLERCFALMFSEGFCQQDKININISNTDQVVASIQQLSPSYLFVLPRSQILTLSYVLKKVVPLDDDTVLCSPN